MTGGKLLVLLSVFVHLARCQKPQVSMTPLFKQLYIGDMIFLHCGNSAEPVKWYYNDAEQEQTSKIFKIAAASSKHSGSYQCESNGQKSDGFPIDIMDYTPSASLILKTGQPVMRRGGLVVLQLENEDGLQGWMCRVWRGDKVRRIKLRLQNDTKHLSFESGRLQVNESIFWCADSTEQQRSNQIILRTSEKDVSLEMYPFPAIVGDPLTLRCLAWGAKRVTRAIFFKDDKILFDTTDQPTHQIMQVKDDTKGRYKCDATFKYIDNPSGSPYHVVSDDQEVFVQVPPIRASLTKNLGLSCSCQACPQDSQYHWYHKENDGQTWKHLSSGSNSMMPMTSGFYACRASWKRGRSLMSSGLPYQSPINLVTVVVALLVIALLILTASAVFYCRRRRRIVRDRIYEDVGLMMQNKGDGNYEGLQSAKREAEYDTLHQGATGGQRKEGEYAGLKTDEMKEGVYHTLGMEGAAGGGGGYEALKKGGMKEETYHTLGMEGEAAGGGGYEALKKEGMKEAVYNTLEMEGAAGGGGGYEALKKGGMKEGVYHTLGMEGAAGGEGGDKAAGKDKDPEYEKVEEKAEAK